MMRLERIVVGLLVLTACATPRSTPWRNPNVGDALARQDEVTCRQDADRARSDVGAYYGAKGQTQPAERIAQADQILDACMRARGYAHQ